MSTFEHSLYNLRLHGTVLTARTGKATPQVGIYGQFNAFYVPHRYSYIPKDKKATRDYTQTDTDFAAQNVQINQIKQRFSKDVPIPDVDLLHPQPLDYRTHNFKDRPIEGAAFGLFETLDLSRIGTPQKLSALTGIKPEIAGTLHHNIKLGARNNVLFKIHGKRKMTNEFGEETQSAAFFIRVRATGPYQKVSMRLPESRDAAYRDCFIEGRFDIIPLSAAYKMGIKPMMNAGLEATFEQMYFNEVFEVEQVQPEIEPLPTMKAVTVTNDKGEKVQIHRQRQKRKIGVASKI